MLKPFTILAAFSAALAASNVALAQDVSPLERDFAQPVTVESNRELLDMRANIFRVEGNVIITQGSLIIRADELEIQGFSGGEGQAEKFIAKGSPATYEQEVQDGFIVTASADEIIYDATARILTLTGSAELLQSGNQLKAASITYDIGKQQVSAERNEEQRVRTTFQPRRPEEEGNNN
ncbi:MAG: lipopolysaccharide export system chaperone component LptA [Idiomarinaceae bacterium HL-53]|nr:MAG: lipopolysaccharide export system chaperone component LptA [Idiomarinaceae bacterium HL-53]CUS47430.1 lipopolysaccharide export system protein LptA [Idiomarinaceae bacterium HL-53]